MPEKNNNNHSFIEPDCQQSKEVVCNRDMELLLLEKLMMKINCISHDKTSEDQG